MGDDEDSDGSDHGNSTTAGASGSAGQSQTVVYHGQHHPHVFGLPATPRIKPQPRARKDVRSSPPPPPLAVVGSGRPRPSANRFSAPSLLPAVSPPRPNYKLLHQTRILLKNRLVHGSFRFSTLQTRGTPNAHTSIIYCLQLYTYAEDGRQVLFTGSKDRTVREWNLATGSVERVFVGAHNGSILSLCVYGDYLATAGSDFCVCLWDLRDGSLVQTISDHHDSVLCVRFDAKHLVSCSKDRTVRLYRFKSKTQMSKSNRSPLGEGIVLGTHRAAVNAVSLSGSLVVSASGDKSMRVWDAETGILLHTLEAHHTRGIAAIDIAPPLVLSGSSDKHVRLYDIEKQRGWSSSPEYHDPLPVRDEAQSLEVCTACGGAVGEGVGTERRCVQIRRASVLASEVHSDLVRSVALGPDFVLSGSYDQSIKVSSLASVRFSLY